MKGTKLPQGNMKRLTIIESVQNKVCAEQQHLLLDRLIQCQGMSYFEHFTKGGYSVGLLHLCPVDLDILQQNCPKAQTPIRGNSTYLTLYFSVLLSSFGVLCFLGTSLQVIWAGVPVACGECTKKV